MGDSTGISWTDRTFNPWWGCARVSAACRSCYADTWASRFGHDLWRRNGDRRVTSPANWRTPLKWNREAAASGTPLRVFCASMGDVFEDHPALDDPRSRLWPILEDTTHLRWQVLTKRPENIARMVPASWLINWPSNVMVGATVESPRHAKQRIEALTMLTGGPALFLSCEPLLAPLELDPWLNVTQALVCGCGVAPPGAPGHMGGCSPSCMYPIPSALDWVIVGTESGRKARPLNLTWVERIVSDCKAASVPVFVKQLPTGKNGQATQDLSTFPEHLRVREYPVEVGR